MTRVLVVDDSPTIRKVVSAVLERHGFEAVQAADGQVALDALVEAAAHGGGAEHNGSGAAGAGAARIDLVLVDFVMPRMNGFQLCRAIRQNDHLRTTPVVLMSAKSDRIREHFVQQTGAIDAITKPFDAQALIAVIENAIRRSEAWRSRGEAIAAGIPDDYESHDAIRAATPSEGVGVSRVGLSGDMAIIPIGAALQLLQIEVQTGVLVVTDGKTEVSIAMRMGLIDLVTARGAGSEFRLGRYFIEHNLVTPDDIDRLLRDNAPTPRPPPPDAPPTPPVPRGSVSDAASPGRKLLGDLLVDSGRVTRDQLRDVLAQQSSELVYEVLRWPRGRFEFRREPLPALAESAQLGLPVASVVMEGFRRVDEWRVVEAGLGNFDAVLQVDSGAVDAMGVDRLAAAEERMLHAIDGRKTVREIITHSHMSSFDACKILFQLQEARLVRRRAS
jgi:DNA-binding response OmpR family regulator